MQNNVDDRSTLHESLMDLEAQRMKYNGKEDQYPCPFRRGKFEYARVSSGLKTLNLALIGRQPFFTCFLFVFLRLFFVHVDVLLNFNCRVAHMMLVVLEE